MIQSRIEKISLMNNTNWPMKILYIWEVVAKVLKKGKNDILYLYLGHMGKTHRKKIVLIIKDIDIDMIKICFCDCKLYTSIKIMQNLSNKPILEITTKLGTRVDIVFVAYKLPLFNSQVCPSKNIWIYQK